MKRQLSKNNKREGELSAMRTIKENTFVVVLKDDEDNDHSTIGVAY